MTELVSNNTESVQSSPIKDQLNYFKPFFIPIKSHWRQKQYYFSPIRSDTFILKTNSFILETNQAISRGIKKIIYKTNLVTLETNPAIPTTIGDKLTN